MKTKTKIITSIIALILSCVLLFVAVTTINNHMSLPNAMASIRTVELSDSAIDVQSVFNEFEDATLTKEGNTTYFEGYKPLDKSALSKIDYINEEDFEYLEESTVKYNFSYNSETNIVTLSATAILTDGTIQVDEISGVGFINDNNEIDAVMNFDGEGILLSEMRDAGLIQNCGWFSKLIKAVAVAVAVVAVVAAAAAIVVATAGAAAPAVVAAGIGVSTTVVAGAVATATTIGTYAAITAAIAAGVALSAELWEQYYPGISVTTTTIAGTKTYIADWSKTKTKEAIKDLVKSKRADNDPEVFFHVTAYNQVSGPTKVELKAYTKSEMASNMALQSWSSLTYSAPLAQSVLIEAFPALQLSDVHTKGMAHYHMLYPGTKVEAKGANGLYVVHSFFTDILAV